MELVGRLIREHGITEIIHFAGSAIVPESVSDPLKYYRNNTATSRNLIEAAVKGGVKALHLFLDRGGLRHDRARAGRGDDAAAADVALWPQQADDRMDAAGRRRGAPDQVRRAALFQRRRRRSAEALRPVVGRPRRT